MQGVVREEGGKLLECLCGLGVRFEVGLENLLQFSSKDGVSRRLLLVLGRRGSTAGVGGVGLCRGHDEPAPAQHCRGHSPQGQTLLVETDLESFES